MPEFRIGRLHGRFVVTWHEDGRRRRHRLEALNSQGAEAEALALIAGLRARAGLRSVEDVWHAYRAAKGDIPAVRNMVWTGPPILRHFGALAPDQIDGEICKSYTAHRRAAGIADGTIWTELGHLATALNWAAKASLIPRAPHIQRPAKPAPRDRHLTRAEIARLLDADAQPHIRLAILLMLTTAARVGAILDLTWDRVDLDRGQINLRLPDATTRKGRAVVPINATARDALLTARAAALSPYVIEYAGGPVRSIRKGFQAACQRAGLTGVSPHVLRHSAAVHMAEGGVAMSVISQYLGHSNEAITAKAYARYSPEYLRGAAAILDFAPPQQVQRTKAHNAKGG